MPSEFTPVHRAPFGGEYYVFRDAVHNLIEIEDSNDGTYVRNLLRTPELQRLRRIRQNGLCSLVYPSIETTRFPHALGSFHIARRMMSSLIERQPTREDGFPECLRLTTRDCLAFSAAALLHDIGHGPLSHFWEECWAEPLGLNQFHEQMGARIVSDTTTPIGQVLAKSDAHAKFTDIGRDVLHFLSKTHPLDYLLPLLGGNLDVDRLDFIARDTRSAGVTYGFHDLEWIIRSLRFARLPSVKVGDQPRWVIAIDGRKGLSTLVQFLHARENMYRLVYHHKTARAATRMLELILKRAGRLAKDKTLSGGSDELRDAITLERGKEISLAHFLKLDDADVWQALKAWADAGCGDQILRELSQRLLSRDLFKVFLLSEDVYDRLREIDSSEAGQKLRTIVKMRLNCTLHDAEYFYAFDKKEFDVIGRLPEKRWHDVWIMESAALGFEFRTLREYWEKEVHAAEPVKQHLLLVHPAVVQDLASIVDRLSFRSESAKQLKELPSAPPGYRLVAPLGTEGKWKEVYVGTSTVPGSEPENIVALKRYKITDIGAAAVERDVTAINLLVDNPHPNLSKPRLLQHDSGELWILEPLWTASLEDFVKRHGPRRDNLEIVEIAEQLFSGLAELHAHELRHTDIKPDNCGILPGGLEKKTYVLGDFGCLSASPDELPSDPRLLGTLRTRAPEIVLKQSISLKSDVWSLAATISSLCLLKYPFMPFDAPHHNSADRTKHEERIVADIAKMEQENRQNVKNLLPPILGRALQRCFERPSDRPSAKEVFETFQSIRTTLCKRTDPLFRTAWQRAEDIVGLFKTQRHEMRARGLSAQEKSEIRGLVKDHKDFIPLHLKTSLAQILRPARRKHKT
jgi:HD superfamily phosphohydrolase/serine/threonine protein kinase